VYHRQIYKHALSTRILTDPRQKRFVASRSLRHLFSLTDTQHTGTSETGAIFKGVSKQLTAADLGSAPKSAHETDLPTAKVSNRARGAVPGMSSTTSRNHTSSQEDLDGSVSARHQVCTAGLGAAELDSSKQRDGDPEAVGGHGSMDDDSAILRELFAGQGLHSALNHSAIEGASDPVKMDVERQAAKVAQRAAAALRASREVVQLDPVHMYAFTASAAL
jgi:DNA excision repair protein ERCC-6